MTAPSPKYHWQFNERQGTTTVDTVSSVPAKLSNIAWLGHGRIGNAIRLDGRVKNSRIVFDQNVARFGTSDFTVAFGMKVQGTYGQKVLHIIGNRSTSGHGNFFSLRMKNQGQLTFEVDENTRGKNYAFLDSKRPLKDGKWHHITAVRQGRSLKLYIDGELTDQSSSKTGIASITTDAALLLGARGLKTAIAQYEDLRIYHTALNATEVKALVPPVNRPLRDGEIELIAADDAAVVLTQNVDDLSHFSNSFKQLRVANNTGVTLYQQSDFKGTAQKCYADLPDMRLSRIKTFPKSIRIWSTVGEPFTGKWIIKAPNGKFLSLGKNRLTTVPPKGSNKLFKFHHNLQQAQLQLMPGSDHENAFFTLSSVEAPTYLFVDESDSLPGEFSLINQAKNEWLELFDSNTFRWTQQKDSRAIFVRVVKVADNESQVGELASGEVALYEHLAHHGKTWILSDSAKHVFGEHTRFGDFQGLNDQTSSIRLGPDTGVTLFKHFNYHVAEDKREEEIEDIVKNVPDLRESQIGDETLSSIKIFRTIEPEEVFSSYTTKLSQDYRMVGDTLEEFSSYRTTLRFKSGADEIEVAATDVTQIEVEGTTYDIDEERSVTLSPNQLNLIMITSEADGLDTPGLKIRTSKMALNERVVIFPNQEAHQQIAELEDGALWNAKDAKGNLIVDRKAHTKEEVASTQNTIKRVMATVTYGEDTPTAKNRVQSANRAVSGTTIDKPWELTLGSTGGNTPILPDDGQQLVVANPLITERQVNSDEWQQLLAQATPAEEESSPEASGPVTLGTARVFAARRFGRRLGRKFKNAVKKATSVVIGKVKDVVHVIVKTVEGVIDFVVDTVEKVADFVEGVVETVVESIKQFIEFLQFLFDWKDILKTQRYLVNAINAGFDYSTHLVSAAKEPLSEFVDDLQDTVETGINSLIESLGGNPSELQGKSKLPEAAEWFFSKMMGGAKQDDAKPTPDLGKSNVSGSALTGLLAGFEDVVSLFLRGFEGLTETITLFVTNPLKPQLALIVLLETLKDIIIQALDIIEKIALQFLDMVSGAIAQFQNLLNAKINIPFITGLFKLIGAGDLTLLNLTGLLVAIPVTIVHKIIFNERPFKDAAPLDFAPQSDLSVATVVSSANVELSSASEQTNAARESSIRGWGVVSLIADLLNGLSTAILDGMTVLKPSSKKGEPFEDVFDFDFDLSWLETITLVLDGVSWLASFPTSIDEQGKEIPGGRPYTLLPVHRDDSEQVYRERVMWGWRTAVLGLDLLVSLRNPLKRMKRQDAGTNIIFFLLSAVDVGLTSWYLLSIPKQEKPGFEIANEVVALLPDLFSPLLLVGPKGSAALALLDVIAAVVNTGLGGKLLADDLADLQAV